MKLVFYPDMNDITDFGHTKKNCGRVGKLLANMASSDLQLYLRVESFLKNLTEIDNIEVLMPTKIKPLKKGLMEMRIPPTRKAGVCRIYFCRHGDELILLDGEVKHETAAGNIDAAMRLMKEYIRS